MDVGSSFRIYGDLFGWGMFDHLYSFFLATGLWLIPFFVFFYQVFAGARGNGEGYEYKPFVALKMMEGRVYGALIVIALFLYPAVPVHKATFIYNDGRSIQTAGKTGTTYDELAASMPDGVYIPVGWYAVMKTTSAVNTTIKTLLPKGDDFRALMYLSQQMGLSNKANKLELSSFNRHCSRPANIRYNVIQKEHSNSLIFKKIADLHDKYSSVKGETYKVNSSYPGNLIYMNILYKNNRCVNDREGVKSSCIPPTESPLTPQASKYGYTDCGGWWGDLKVKLKDDYMTFDSSFNSSLPEKFKTIYTAFFVDEDEVIAGQMGRPQMSTKNSGGIGENESIMNWFKEKAGAAGVSVGVFFMQFATQVIQFMLPILLAIIMMVLIMLLPIFIIFSLYNIEKTMTLLLLFFGISFLPAVWHIAAWIDNIMIKSLWGRSSYVESIGSMEQAAWSVVSLIIYLLLTKWWLGMLGSLGVYASSIVDGLESGSASGMSALKTGVSVTSKAIKR